MSEYVLQNRWRLEGRKLCYYGLRNRENLFRTEKIPLFAVSSCPAVNGI